MSEKKNPTSDHQARREGYHDIVDDAIEAEDKYQEAKHEPAGPSSASLCVKGFTSKFSIAMLVLLVLNIGYLVSVRMQDQSEQPVTLEEANKPVQQTLKNHGPELDPMSREVLQASLDPEQDPRKMEAAFRKLRQAAERGDL